MPVNTKPHPIRRIVVGVDGSEPSAAALAWAIEMARGMHAEIVAVFGLDVPVDLSLGFAPISAAMYQPEWRATLKTNAGGRVDRPTQGVRVAPTGDESGSGRRTPSEPEEEEEPAAWSHKFGGLYGGLSQWKALGYPRGVTDADPIAVAPTPRPRPLDANQPTTTSRRCR
jgi:Universal stress protein family